MAVCEKILEIMQWRGIKQTHLSEHTNIPQSTLSRYLNSDDDLPYSAVPKIAEALGVSLWTLLNGDPMSVTAEDITREERLLVEGYRALTPELREAVQHVVRAGGLKP